MEKQIIPIYLNELQHEVLRAINFGNLTVREIWIQVLDRCSFSLGNISERRVKRILDDLCDQGILKKDRDQDFPFPAVYTRAISVDDLARGCINPIYFGALATYQGEAALDRAVKYHRENFH